MGFKTLTIKQTVYRELVKAKHSGESFSGLFERMLHEKRPNLMEFFGAWKDIGPEEEKRINAAMKDFRSRADTSLKERLARNRP